MYVTLNQPKFIYHRIRFLGTPEIVLTNKNGVVTTLNTARRAGDGTEFTIPASYMTTENLPATATLKLAGVTLRTFPINLLEEPSGDGASVEEIVQSETFNTSVETKVATAVGGLPTEVSVLSKALGLRPTKGVVNELVSTLASGIEQKAGSPTVHEWTTPQTNTAFTIPAGAKAIELEVQGAGGGGGSGRRGAALSARVGGGGGAGGGRSVRKIPVGSLTTLYITVGTGGAGAAGMTTDDTNGNNGTAGSLSAIRSGTANNANNGLVSAAGGNGGQQGAAGQGAGGTVITSAMFVGTAGGAANGSGSTGVAAATSQGAAAGGGAGGGITTANVNAAGGAGGIAGGGFPGQATAGTAGGGNGAAGEAGGAVLAPGNGGAGGGGNASGAGGNGGNGINGSGGGGGGSSVNGSTSGAGGNGGDGYAKIIVWY
jgi:hypothetical protein